MIDLIGYKRPDVEDFVIETITDKGIGIIYNYLHRQVKEIIDKKCIMNIDGKDNDE